MIHINYPALRAPFLKIRRGTGASRHCRATDKQAMEEQFLLLLRVNCYIIAKKNILGGGERLSPTITPLPSPPILSPAFRFIVALENGNDVKTKNH